MSKHEEPDEAVQRHIAERMGITWDAYAARARKGVQAPEMSVLWPRGWARVKFAWRPDEGLNRKAEVSPETVRYAEELRVADLEHNAAILDAIPKTEPVPASDPLTVAVQSANVAEGMAVKFLGARCVDVLGMRGYTPVLDAEGKQVRVGQMLMAQIPRKLAGRRREVYMEASREAVAMEIQPTDRTVYVRSDAASTDIWRLTWHIWGWRGVLALYEYIDANCEERYPFLRKPPGPLRRRGIEMQTQWHTRYPKLRRLRFYKLGE